MPAYDGGKSCRSRIDIEIRDIVHEVNVMRAGDDDISERERHAPRIAIVVAAHCECRCDFPQTLEHLRRADVAGMNDEIAAAQCRERLVAQQTMRVGYDADVFDRINVG